jgi:SAM-dependent methyltransferase
MFFSLLRRIADNSAQDSVASRLRMRRMAIFGNLIASLPRPLRILDVGGTEEFWRIAFGDLEGLDITLLNMKPGSSTDPHFHCVTGDARSMPQFGAGQFDIVFSNSVIEHVGDWNQQWRMANEIRRIGKRFFVQTPNRYFPIEPHFLVPGFQFLPLAVRIAMVRRWKLGWWPRIRDKEEARKEVESIRLLKKSEVQKLFPGATVGVERFLGLPKSFFAYSGFPVSSS